jgi:hypothetical protein
MTNMASRRLRRWAKLSNKELLQVSGVPRVVMKDLGGAYCEDVDIAAVASEDAHGKYGVKPWASAPILAEQLWRASEISWGHVLTLSWP